ncbi:alpha/beta hydrolase family protein [Pendulispora albinea]|uniref:Alpha/beta fold hydrolase n=1 Tax=Pendulispora albinea TaxID=2741071 RepID=A0ABZ2MA65_9BACT
MDRFDAGLEAVTFFSNGCRLLGGFYRAAGNTRLPAVVLLHGAPGIEKHLDIAYRLRDRGCHCLYFHFRGSWGSEGAFSFTGLVDDAAAAVAWARSHPAVDPARIVLVGGAMGGHAALLLAAADPRIRATVAVCPLIDPRAFLLPESMAAEFAPMLKGVTPRDLSLQWNEVRPLPAMVDSLVGRSVLLVTAERDELFPPSHYAGFIDRLPTCQHARAKDADHAFSTCRPWLVRTVTDWIGAELGIGASEP